MVALPSVPETASRTAPVALFTTETLASFTTAPAWSTTTTIIDAVLGDCAEPLIIVAATKAKIASRGRGGCKRFLDVILCIALTRHEAGKQSNRFLAFIIQVTSFLI